MEHCINILLTPGLLVDIIGSDVRLRDSVSSPSMHHVIHHMI